MPNRLANSVCWIAKLHSQSGSRRDRPRRWGRRSEHVAIGSQPTRQNRNKPRILFTKKIPSNDGNDRKFLVRSDIPSSAYIRGSQEIEWRKSNNLILFHRRVFSNICRIISSFRVMWYASWLLNCFWQLERDDEESFYWLLSQKKAGNDEMKMGKVFIYHSKTE